MEFLIVFSGRVCWCKFCLFFFFFVDQIVCFSILYVLEETWKNCKKIRKCLRYYLDFLLSLLLVALLLLLLHVVVLFWKCTPLVFLFCVQISCSHKDTNQITLIRMVKNLLPVQETGLGRSSGDGNGCPLHYPCLENSMDWRAWQAIFHEVAKSLT